MAKLVRRFPQLGLRCLKWSNDVVLLNGRTLLKDRCENPSFQLMKSTPFGHSIMANRSFSVITNRQFVKNEETTSDDEEDDEDKHVNHQTSSQISGNNNDGRQAGDNVRRKDRVKSLIENLTDMNDDSKEAIYEALDSWVAWEQNFPIGHLKRVIFLLEKDKQWHRVIQVIKWMLSKGQGNTRGSYAQLIRALDMDNRAEEAHQVWEKKIGFDLHSVPWQLCQLMVAVYYRNNMPERTVKLFKGLEDFDRKPPEKSIVQRVADAYELLGKTEEKERVLEKYKDLFSPKKFSSKNRKKTKAKDVSAAKEETG